MIKTLLVLSSSVAIMASASIAAGTDKPVSDDVITEQRAALATTTE